MNGAGDAVWASVGHEPIAREDWWGFFLAGRGRGFWPSTGLLPSTPASSLMTKSPALVIGLETVLAARPLVHHDAQAPSSAPARLADSPAWVPARRVDRARCPKRRRSARAPCNATPKAHRKHSENTPKTPAHRTVSWRDPRHRGFNPLRFGHIRPNNPHQSTPPARRPHRKQPTPQEQHAEDHE